MPGDGQGVSVPLSLFSGLVTELSVPDLPEGLSPDNQDIVFLPGSVGSRPGLHKVYSTPISGNVTVVYQKTYVQPNGQPLTLILDSSGNLWKEDVTNSPGTLSKIGSVPAGSYAQSCSAFGREYIATSDGIHGNGIPLQYDGTFLDRVTQDGPGAAPTLANFLAASATISNTGPGSTVNISTVSPTNQQVYQIGYPPHPFYVWNKLQVACTGPHGLSVGDLVTLTGITPSSFDVANAPVTDIINSTTFNIGDVVYFTPTGGTGGSFTVQAPSLVRTNNVVTATTAAPHGFQVGWQVQISGISNDTIVSIDRVIRDANGNVFVDNFTTPFSTPVGSTIAITGVTNPDASFNGTFVVTARDFPGQLTYQQAGTAEQSTAGTGNIQNVWTGTFIIQSVPSPTTFTYTQLGANDSTNLSGTATIIGQVSPGNHSCVLMFLTRQGYLTAPSKPVLIDANGAQQLSVTNMAIGPSNVVARVLAFTGAGGDNYFTLLTTPQVAGQVVGSALIINDNTTTNVIVDFADNTLFGGTGIDIPGRNQFAQVVLAPCSGFFGYASRVFAWGELNKIQNFVNMGFDGGYLPMTTTNPAGSGANSGSGTAWTNPSNITSSSSYADVSLSAAGVSQVLLSEAYAFSVSGNVSLIQGSFQYYWTGTPSAQPGIITIQLLKAGVPTGTVQQIVLSTGSSQGASASPITAAFQFAVTNFAAADVNNAAFGLQIFFAGDISNAIHLFVRAGTIAVSTISPTPLGWTSTGSTAVNGQLTPTTIAGFDYVMTSAGGLFDSLVEQPAFQDVNGIAILTPSTQYLIRLNVTAQTGILAGSLVADLFSPSTGTLATASFLGSLLPTSEQFVQMNFTAKTPVTIPADTTLRIYLSSITSGKTVAIDEVELAPVVKPYLDNTMRGSYVNGPEQFDSVTGNIGPTDDTSPLRCMFELRGFMYMYTAKALHDTSDNGTGEPSTWTVKETAQACGALSLKATDTGSLGTQGSGEEWQFTATRTGLHIFWGAEPIKISQEIQTIWESINFSAAQTIFVKNNSVTRRCYVGVPINGATAPNVLLVLDYRELNDPYSIASTAPFRQSYSGRILAVEICRKWTRWNVQSNSGEIITRPGNVEQFIVGAGNGQTPGAANGFGNLYFLDPAKLTDDDYGQIVPYWTSYFFISDDQAQQLGIDSHRKLATYFTAFLNGVGQTAITPLSDTLANAYPPFAPYPLNTAQNHDLEWNINVDGERIAVKIGSTPATGQTDNSFNLQKLCLTLKKHPWSPVRGSI